MSEAVESEFIEVSKGRRKAAERERALRFRRGETGSTERRL